MSKELCEIQLGEGRTLYFENFHQLQENGIALDSNESGLSKLRTSKEALKQAAEPLIEVLESLRESTLPMGASEMELSMQLELAANGEIPILKVLSFGSSCQISAKFVWKKDDDKTPIKKTEV